MSVVCSSPCCCRSNPLAAFFFSLLPPPLSLATLGLTRSASSNQCVSAAKQIAGNFSYMIVLYYEIALAGRGAFFGGVPMAGGPNLVLSLGLSPLRWICSVWWRPSVASANIIAKCNAHFFYKPARVGRREDSTRQTGGRARPFGGAPGERIKFARRPLLAPLSSAGGNKMDNNKQSDPGPGSRPPHGHLSRESCTVLATC